MEKYKEVFVFNRRWALDKQSKNPDFFEKLAQGQNPDFLFIGCSDSRVPANEVMGLEPGDVFVHRNIANIISNNDLNAHAVIQYAIEYLNVKHVVVCGHYDCGGIKAAMNPQDMGLLNGWLRNITDVYRIHFEELQQINDEQKRFDRLVELNVQEQCINILKSSYFQKQYLKNGFPTVHGWVYNIHNGHLKDLNLDFEALLDKYMDIIKLFPQDI